jgi:hypothetical protein
MAGPQCPASAGKPLVSAAVCAVQTYNVACEWTQVLQQMFQASGLPLIVLVANKADTQQLQALAAGMPVPASDPCAAVICRCEA